MADPDLDHGMIHDDNGFLDIKSPFLDFQFNPDESVEEYVNRIAYTVAQDAEARLGISEWLPDTPVHPSVVALQALAPPPPLPPPLPEVPEDKDAPQ